MGAGENVLLKHAYATQRNQSFFKKDEVFHSFSVNETFKICSASFAELHIDSNLEQWSWSEVPRYQQSSSKS